MREKQNSSDTKNRFAVSAQKPPLTETDKTARIKSRVLPKNFGFWAAPAKSLMFLKLKTRSLYVPSYNRYIKHPML